MTSTFRKNPNIPRGERRLATIRTACGYLDISRMSIYRLKRDGELQVINTPVGPRIDLDEVDSKIAEWSKAADQIPPQIESTVAAE